MIKKTVKHIDRVKISIHRSYGKALLERMKSDVSTFKSRGYRRYGKQVPVRTFTILKTGDDIKLVFPREIPDEPEKARLARLVSMEFNGRRRATLVAVKQLLQDVFGSEVDQHCFIRTLEVRHDLYVKSADDTEELLHFLSEGLIVKNCPDQMTRRIGNTIYFGHEGYAEYGSKGLKLYPRSDLGDADTQQPPFKFLRFEMSFNQPFMQKRKVRINDLTTFHLKYDPLDFIQYRRLRTDDVWEQIHSDALEIIERRVDENKKSSKYRFYFQRSYLINIPREQLLLDHTSNRLEDMPIANQIYTYKQIVKWCKLQDRTNYYFPYNKTKQRQVEKLLRDN
jgi:hypothetical protein